MVGDLGERRGRVTFFPNTHHDIVEISSYASEIEDSPRSSDVQKKISSKRSNILW
jgi:hypothetical protein